MIMKTDFADKGLQAEIDRLCSTHTYNEPDSIVEISGNYHLAIRWRPGSQEMLVFFYKSGPEYRPSSNSIADNYCGGFNIYEKHMQFYSLESLGKEGMLEELSDNHPELFEWCLWNLA
jgi:hypothetical protein